MKKNKLYVFIVLLTVALIFGAAASCPECENRKITSSSGNPVYQDTADTAKPDPNLIHGVLPIKVTGHATGNKTKDEGSLEFWNVGRIGGEEYSKATYIITRNGKTIKTYEGYFAGGPNGEMRLTSNDGKDIHGQLVSGIEFISDDGSVIDIDNSDAFDGWTDEIPSDDNTEDFNSDVDVIAPEKDAAETDANLHGLVPTKISVHTHQATDDKDSYSDHYIEFWNIGELGGEQYAKATDHYVATRDGAQFSEITFEGTFTGGPNGLIEMSAVSSSGNDEGSTAKMVLQLIDGKQLENPSNGYILQIVNPEALVEAFDGWKD